MFSNSSDWIQSAVVQFEGPLLRYARKMTGELELARDAVQDTFIRLCQQDPARIDDHLGEWLFTVCRNRIVDLRRRDKKMSMLSDSQIDEKFEPSPSPVDRAEASDSLSRILRELETLSESQQEVIRLKFQNDLSYKEISRVTGHSISNVGVLIHTALKTLRKRLGTARGSD